MLRPMSDIQPNPEDASLPTSLQPADGGAAASSSASPAVAQARAVEANPFVAALIGIGISLLIVGIIVLIVGVSNAASYSPGDYSGHDDSGLGEQAVGNALASLGGLLTIAGLIVAGFDWSIRNRARL